MIILFTQKDVENICRKELSKINLGSGCDFVASSMAAGNQSRAARELEKIVLHSVANCLYEVLKEYDSKLSRK